MPSSQREAWERHLTDRGLVLAPTDSRPKRNHTQRERGALRQLVKAANLRWWRPYLFHVEHWNPDPKVRAALKGCAVASGLPDLWLMLPRPPHQFAVLELKEGAPATDDQLAWLHVMALCGAGICEVVEGWDKAFHALDMYAGAQRDDDPPPPYPDLVPTLAALRDARAMQSAAAADVRARGVGAGDCVSRGGGGDPP